ncbi:hypothetical protein MVEG_10803 [Podila verticillata NRRL 6337]|nr:hypothetical protein MVEG_10803 [Podila verticillata NRRL 6337]
MAPYKNDNVPAFQAFKTEDGKPLQKLPAQICPETGYKCIFWQDVLNTFDGVDYVEGPQSGVTSRVLFLVDQYGEVMLPLRIRRDRTITYRVIYRERKGQLSPALELQYLYRSWSEASKSMIAEYTLKGKASYELSGNAAYYRSKMLEQLVLMKDIGVEAEVDGKTEGQILDELQEFQQQVSEWEYAAACRSVAVPMNIPAPYLFLVLPADLGSWDDSDPTTQNFRLYFLCNFKLYKSVGSSLPQHKHLSNHPGYNLIRQQEFFRIYGKYSLVVLKMVKQGFSYKRTVFPPLDTFEILWNFDPEVARNHITKDTIGPLIDKSISYLETLSLPPFSSEKWRAGLNIDAVKNFLLVPEGSNPLGGLDRFTTPDGYWCWTCSQHGLQWMPPGAFDALVHFVQGCGGHVDTQLATFKVELSSKQHMDQLCTLLNNTEQIIDVSVKLGWPASRRDLDNILRKIAGTKVEHLVLDGITRIMYPQGNIEYGKDLFYDHINSTSRNGKLESVTLLNYPRPQEQNTYFCSSYSNLASCLHWRQLQRVEIGLWLTDLKKPNVENLVNAIVTHQREGLPIALQYQHDLLAKAGSETVFAFSMKQSNWHGEFDMNQGTLRALQVYELSALDTDYSSGHVTTVALGALQFLRTLTFDTSDPNIDRVIARTVQASPQLVELNISLQESRALEQAARSIEMWHHRPGSLLLTLLERDNDSRGYIVAQALVHGHADIRLGSNNSCLQEVDFILEKSQGWKSCTSAKVDFLQWRGDYISTPLTDGNAAFLNMVAVQHPSVLTSFVLDILLLSRQGLSHLQAILYRSILTNLHVVCTALDPSLTDFVRQVLLNIQWSTLQSLIFSGSAVNEWIQLLAMISSEKTLSGTSLLDLQLKSFRIQGSGKNPTSLSHSSMLFVHQLAYWNPSMELVLEDVCLQDGKDMDLVAGSRCS